MDYDIRKCYRLLKNLINHIKMNLYSNMDRQMFQKFHYLTN